MAFDGEQKKVSITTDKAYYDSIASKMKHPEIIILDEDNDIMFADIDKIVAYDNLYYILDKSSGRVAVSFTNEGIPFAQYGTVGQGPGEYVFPWDMEVDDTGVYILDSNSKKVIHYDREGKFIEEKGIPFFADAFIRLNDGKFVFNLMPEGKSMPQISVCDSTMKEVDNFLTYDEKYLGGISTRDILSNSRGGYSYYRCPKDTIFLFNQDFVPESRYILDFNGTGVSELAKNDFIAARHNERNDSKMMLVNNPFQVKDDLFVGIISSDDEQFTIMFNPEDNKCGGRKFDSNSSVYDIIEPFCVTQDGKLISVMEFGIAERCRDYDTLPETVKAALEKAARVLVIHDFSNI